MNKDNNNKYEAIRSSNGVRYVNTTHDEFITRMSDMHKESLIFNLSTQKVDEYLCDLGPAPDDANKDWGCVYQFPHYLIHSPVYRIEPDMDDDMVDITPICSYNENATVLINKKDMSKPGFKRFILDSCDSIIVLLNSLKIPVTKDPEKVAAYCQMMTMIQFINRYNKYMHIFHYNFKDVLVHSLDHDYRVYRIATIPEDGTIRGNDVISYYDKNLNKKVVQKVVDTINDIDDNSIYPTSAKPVPVVVDEEDENKLKEHIKRLSRARFIRGMMEDKNLKQTLCADWPKYLEGLIDLFNGEIKDGCPIKNAWNTTIGKIIKEFVDFIYNNAAYICELRQEKDVTFTIKVNEQYQLELMVGVYEEDDEDDEVYYAEPGDKLGIYYRNPIDEDSEELD